MMHVAKPIAPLVASRKILWFLATMVIIAPGITSGSFAAELIKADEAQRRLVAEEIVLIDVRRPSEWRDSGVAKDALTISMHEPGFLEKLDAAIADNPDKPVAIICAVGGRTGWLSGELEKRGYTGILDVSEGMMGSTYGPGWLRRGLPTRLVP